MAKSTAKKTTRKAAPRKTSTTSSTDVATPIAQKSCAYPSCSARASQEFGEKKVPSCDHHAEIFETQADDGAGIQQLMAGYTGP